MSALSSDQAWRLVTTGLTLGGLHVLTPDHVASLSALTVGSSWRSFQLGVRWGVGHSSGLLLVTGVFIYLKGDFDLRRFGRLCDGLVGTLMIVIGFYGVFGAIKNARERRKLKIDGCSDTGAAPPSGTGGEEVMFLTRAINSMCDVETSSEEIERRGTTRARRQVDWGENFHAQQTNPEKSNPGTEDCSWCPFLDMRDPFTQRIVSFLMGVLHGSAGPGGVLAVFPTVQMTSWKPAALYLGSFIIASTFSMGLFASVYGETTRRLGSKAESVEIGLRIFSAFSSLVIGAIWLSLSMLGKLEELIYH